MADESITTIRNFKDLDTILSDHENTRAEFVANSPVASSDSKALVRSLHVVHVVTQKDDEKLQALYEKYRPVDGKYGSEKNGGKRIFANLMNQFSNGVSFDENGQLDEKSQSRLGFLKSKFGAKGELDFIDGVLEQHAKFCAAKDKCFLLESEMVETGPLLRQFIFVNHDFREIKKVGFSRENAYFLETPQGVVVAGSNHLALGNNKIDKSTGTANSPTTYGVFTFVTPEGQRLGVGRFNYEYSDRTMITNLEKDPNVRKNLIAAKKVIRTAEINTPELMSFSQIAIDQAGSVISTFDRMRFLQEKIGYRALDFSKIAPGLRYIEPEYDDGGGTRFCHYMVSERAVSTDANGKIVLGSRTGPQEVAIETVIAHFKNAFIQTFGRTGAENDEAQRMIKILERAQKRGVKTIPTIPASEMSAKMDLWEKRYNAIKQLVGDRDFADVHIRIDYKIPGQHAFNTTLAQDKIKRPHKDIKPDDAELSLKTIYDRATIMHNGKRVTLKSVIDTIINGEAKLVPASLEIRPGKNVSYLPNRDDEILPPSHAARLSGLVREHRQALSDGRTQLSVKDFKKIAKHWANTDFQEMKHDGDGVRFNFANGTSVHASLSRIRYDNVVDLDPTHVRQGLLQAKAQWGGSIHLQAQTPEFRALSLAVAHIEGIKFENVDYARMSRAERNGIRDLAANLRNEGFGAQAAVSDIATLAPVTPISKGRRGGPPSGHKPD